MATMQEDLAFMQLALLQATEAAAAGEVPVGAVVVHNGVVVGTGRNSPIHDCDPSAHAEIVALRDAARNLGNYRLDDCTLYVTLEPCAMCCGGILHARLARVVFGAWDSKCGCAGSVLNLFDYAALNHQTAVTAGVLAEAASAQLQAFFKGRREAQKAHAWPLREDALRTPDRCFANLPDAPGTSHYASDLASLAGLRMHYRDAGAANAETVLVCLHSASGWGHSFHTHVAGWIEQGARVLLPDLIGFGRSDKPKREAVHSMEFHLQVLQEWLERLQLRNVTLVLPHGGHILAQPLVERSPKRIVAQRILAPDALDIDAIASSAPYPDAGHRAAERAWAAWQQRPPIIQP